MGQSINNGSCNLTAAVNDTTLYEELASYFPTNTSGIQFVTYNFTVQTQPGGFYFALVDNGTSVTVSRILVYRLKGPAKQVNLTYFRETPAPVSGTITVEGNCVANANTTIGSPPKVTLDSMGKWSNPDMCVCIEGHQPVMLEGSLQCQGGSIIACSSPATCSCTCTC